ncbi:MAG: ABC-F family ATP-binding cassette domain-containing protein [Clostridium sp.]|nr:ABC-F family ATP-binding cassette domain-containing protein [Clostridium sp.]
MNVLNVENVSKVYGDKVLLDQVCLGINEGDKLGVIGVNGCGKSTFLKMIAGISGVDSGNIIKRNQSSIAYLAQTMEFSMDDTVMSYVTKDKVSSNPNWNIEAEAKTILNRLHIYDPEGRLATMSGGEQKRVALARTLLAPADILVLDEPTNHLDSGMVRWLEEYLIKYKGILIMVTHDRYFLDRVTNKIVEIDKGKLYTYEANYSGFLELKQARMEQEAASYRKVQSVLRTEIEWVRRGAQARSTKQKARLERFQEMQTMKAPEQDKQVEMDSVASRMGKKTLEIDHISKSYGNKKIISDFTYYTIRNERIGIIGENGCGKTTLLRIILGLEPADSGTVTIGETIKIGYFSQMVEDMNPEERVIDYVKNVAEYIRTSKGTTTASQMCERFLFGPETQYNPIGKLSGGERRRLYLLKVLMGAPNVLILDEPTNDLDITTLAILEDYLDVFEGIVITVSHDRYFLDRVVNRIFAFEGNGIITQYEGGYTDYYEKALASGKLVDSMAAPVKGTDREKKPDSRSTWKNNREEKIKFTYKEQREYETIDADIAELEEKIAAIDVAMGEAVSDYNKLTELSTEKEELEQQLEEKMDRWVYLNDLAERIENAK